MRSDCAIFGDCCGDYEAVCAAPECGDGICGDGLIRGSEGCDDSGTSAGDGCSASCDLESCGNGVIECDEICLFTGLDGLTQCRTQLIQPEHLRRVGMPQAVTLDSCGDHQLIVNAFHGVCDGHTQQAALPAGLQRGNQLLDILDAHAGSRRVMHQHPVAGISLCRKVVKAVEHRVTALRTAVDTLQRGCCVARLDGGPVFVIG